MADDVRKRAIERFAVESERRRDDGPSNPNLFDVDVIACVECGERHHVMPEDEVDTKESLCHSCGGIQTFEKVDELRY